MSLEMQAGQQVGVVLAAEELVISCQECLFQGYCRLGAGMGVWGASVALGLSPVIGPPEEKQRMATVILRRYLCKFVESVSFS